MNQADQILEQEMAKVEAFFISNRSSKDTEGKPCFFRVAHQKTVDASLKFDRCTLFKNFHLEEMSESLQYLKENIRMFGPNSTPYLKVSIVTSERSNNDNVMIIKNPYYQGQNNSIAGFGQNANTIQTPMFQMQQSNQAMILQMQQMMYEQRIQSEKQLAELKHQQEIKDKEDYIAALEDNNRNTLEKLTDLFHSPTGLKLADTLSGLLKINTPPAPSIQATPQQVQQPVEQAQQQTDAPQYTDEQINAANRVNQSIAELGTVFNDPITALEAIVNYAKNNPDIAKSLMSTHQQQ